MIILVCIIFKKFFLLHYAEKLTSVVVTIHISPLDFFYFERGPLLL